MGLDAVAIAGAFIIVLSLFVGAHFHDLRLLPLPDVTKPALI